MAYRTLASFTCLILLLSLLALPVAAQAPGGFLEKSSSTAIRPQLTPSQIQSFLPARGPFTFPAPYNTRGIRLTNSSDCGGTDCVNYVGYSYWRNINNHIGSNDLYVFLSLSQDTGGTGPTLFKVNKTSGAVTNLGPLFAPSNPLYYASGEGWYWSAAQTSKLYVPENFGPRLYRYDVFTRQLSQVFDVSAQFGTDKYIWQVHSSDDDRVHSATLRDKDNFEMLGCLVYREDTAQFSWFPKQGDFDECHVDKSGRWLVTFENLDGLYSLDNRIIDLQTMTERQILDQDGAPGHMDTGFGYLVGNDNWNSLPQAARLYRFDQTPIAGPVVYHDSDWDAVSANHIAHGNARPGVPPEQQFACGSGATRSNVPRGNELVCFKLDTSLDVLVVGPTMIDLDAPGGGNDYAKYPKANLDVTGRYMIWTSNLGGNRLDAFLVEVPYELLTGGAPTGSESVVWTNLVNATASGGSLQKSGGCDGCPDAGATSQQQIAAGDGAVLFTASETGTLRYVGLSHGNANGTGGNIDFAISMGPGSAEVRENGVYRADTTIAPGDRFKVAVEGGVVKYSKNGVSFYTSLTAPTYPLLVDSSLLGAGATVTNAVIERPNGGTTPGGVVWTNLVNATASGGSLQKSGGCDGCPDAGATSQQQIAAGDGAVLFTISETSKLRLVGLSHGNTNGTGGNIDFALSIGSGYAEVRENGVYRADTTAAPGDRFKVAVEGGVVKYYKNGVRFYTSLTAPTYPLLVDSSLLGAGATVTDAVIE